MMKTRQIKYAILLLLMTTGVWSSCVGEDEFNLPDPTINPPQIEGDTVSISTVKSLFMQAANASNLEDFYGDEQLTFEDTDDYMVGYVISSDEAGNFYQELVLQDKPQNPTAGIKIMLQVNPLFTTYEIGQKVYVELDGFTIGFSNGIIALGVPEGDSDYIGEAPEAFADKIIRTPQTDSIVPLKLHISDFARQYDCLFIKLDSVQFPEDIALGPNAKTFAAEPGEKYDALRKIVNAEGQTTALSTSTFADFKALPLPRKSGSLHAILVKTYNGDNYVLKVNTPADIHFDQERFGRGESPPDYQPTIVNLPFKEDFSGIVPDSPLHITGWVNQNANGGQGAWKGKIDNNNAYAQASAQNTGENPYEVWLVSPGLDLSTASAPILRFKTKDEHYNGAALSVYVSTDFSGDVTQATWTKLNNITLSSGHKNGTGNTFVPSGKIDLSRYSGQVVYIGFKYKGADDGVRTTMQIDDILVKNDSDNDSTPPTNGSGLAAFAGADFENWSVFKNGLNKDGLQDYAVQAKGQGVNGSAALHIKTDESTTSSNDYVFTALAIADLPSSYNKMTFSIKGTATNSISINLYKANGNYYTFNLKSVTADKTIQKSGRNSYTGTIDTGGEWVKITLDLAGITDLNTSDTSGDFLALKIGSKADFDVLLDNFEIE